MLVFRWIILLLLVAAVVCFVLYVATGHVRFRKLGLVIVKWTVVAGLGFFAVLVVERLTVLV